MLADPADPRAQGIKFGPLEVGGAVRANALNKSWETRPQRFPQETVEFDTLRGRLDFEQGAWQASVQYRLYYYTEIDRASHFLHHAWLGRKVGDAGELRAGVTKVPFGALPFASNSYFFSLAYYVGLEDDYDLGATYRWQRGRWRVDAGYFPRDEGSAFGDSVDSARYSYDVVKTDDTANSERNQFNGRVSYTVQHGPDAKSEFGLSLEYGQVHNGVTNKDGGRMAVAAHYVGSYGRWGIKLESLAYDFNLENPAGQDDRVVRMGAYDFPYQVAARGHIHSLGLSYTLPMDQLRLETITFYNDYSALLKPEQGFDTTHHNVTGMAFDFNGPLFIYADFALGRDNAWIGPDFATALGSGGDNKWHHRLNFNVGLYF